MRGGGFAAMVAAALVLAACGPQQLTLPSDPIDRAATCAVVSAADARSRQGELDFDAQARVIHHAMLAGVEGQDFSATRASAVLSRMNDLQDDILGNRWRRLIAPCDEAYPIVKKTAGIELPKGRLDAALGCYSMGDFLAKTVLSGDPRARERFADMTRMKRELDGPVGDALKARGAKAQALKEAAFVRMAKLGAPAAVMNICTGRFA